MEVITVTSQGQDAAKFISNFSNSIRLSDNYEVGLLKIAHPPTMNITNMNNRMFIQNKESDGIAVLEIPAGFYETTHDVVQAMQKSLSNYNVTKDDYSGKHQPIAEDSARDVITSATLRYGARNATSADNSRVFLELVDKKSFFLIKEEYQSINILHFLDFRIENLATRGLVINNYDLESKDQIGFVYSSIVSNSLIDYRVSRLLDTVSLKSIKNGHQLFEVQNPVFHDVSAASFIDISFQIRDVDGKLIQFHSELPTILTLGIRKKPK